MKSGMKVSAEELVGKKQSNWVYKKGTQIDNKHVQMVKNRTWCQSTLYPDHAERESVSQES